MKAVFPKKHFHPPKLETEYVVDLGILCCQKTDRDLRKVPNLSAEIAAGEIGEANVENCKIGSVVIEVIKAGLCGRDVSHREIFGFECINQSVRYS